MKQYRTNMGYRLSLKYSNDKHAINWLFLPGGPGFGSESFSNLAEQLELPGKSWYVDYPNDGSNQISNHELFQQWLEGLVELVSSLENVILIAHSFSGSFVLSEPRVENYLKGLILLNTAPDKCWMNESPKQAEKYNLPDISNIQTMYQQSPSNENFKTLSLACAPYFFTKAHLTKGGS